MIIIIEMLFNSSGNGKSVGMQQSSFCSELSTIQEGLTLTVELKVHNNLIVESYLNQAINQVG